MKLKELIDRLYENNETLQEKLSKKDLRAILEKAFETIVLEIEKLENDRVVIPKLGIFTIKTIERNGKKIKRVFFKPTKRKG